MVVKEMCERGHPPIMLKSVCLLALIGLLAALTGDGNPDVRNLGGWENDLSSTEYEQTPFPTRADAHVFAPISSQDARLQNSLAPFSADPIEIALPFFIPLTDGKNAQVGAAIDCLAAAIYFEAGFESPLGKRAVAQVVLNRVRHPAFPNSVCQVVFEGAERSNGCQFTFTCDGSLSRRPTRQDWNSAREFAQAALAGAVEPSVGMSTHYHADYVRPYWAASLDKVAQIGAHIFYRWRGSWGRRSAFNEPVQLRGLDYHPEDWASQGNHFDATLKDPIAPNEVASPQPATNGLSTVATAPVIMQLQPRFTQPRADQTKGVLIADEAPVSLLLD